MNPMLTLSKKCCRTKLTKYLSCHSSKVYPGPLEKVEDFGGLCDFLDTFPLVRGKKKKRPDDDDEEVGEFKVC